MLGGSGRSWQWDGERHELFDVGAGDCLVHLAEEHGHTLIAGEDGLDVLVFGQRAYTGATYLPRANVLRMGPTVDVSPGPHPWEREAAAGDTDLPAEVSERPARIVNLADVSVLERHRGTTTYDWRDLGGAAGSLRTGLRHITVAPGKLSAPHHCHSAEEELFVVLEGDGTLELLPAPYTPWGAEQETHAVRAGSVVARPAGTRMAHAFVAGDQGLKMLAYGTRDPNDIAYYPRSQKVYMRGAGLIFRAEHVDYWDGEE